MDIIAFWSHLKATLATDCLSPASLTPEELAAVEKLKSEKYDTWQWNYGSSPKYATVIRRRHAGGMLEIHLTVKHGCINSVAIYGDFLALTPLDDLITALTGCPYREAALRHRLASLPISDYLGTITIEEFLSTILND